MNDAPSPWGHWMRLHAGTRRATLAGVAFTAFSTVTGWRNGGAGEGIGMGLTCLITFTIVVVLVEMYRRNARRYP